MKQRHILVVDDEPLNLEIIGEFLDAPEYVLELLPNAQEAWQRLASGAVAYDLAILDRMMPGMTGIDLLRQMKADARFRAIPVIMQTAASAPEQVREGIEAGAYYYLAKPYAPETLLAIVRAALGDIEARELAVQRAAAQIRAMAMLDRAEFHLRTPEEIGPLVELLSSMCPAPEPAAMGLGELLMNAVEHGNLEISYAEKKRLRLTDSWDAEIRRRLTLPQFAERLVRVRVERRAERLEFTIVDAGAGFEWHRYLELDPERAADPNGRGIAMARMLGFSEIEYRGCGNTVVVSLRPAAAADIRPKI